MLAQPEVRSPVQLRLVKPTEAENSVADSATRREALPFTVRIVRSERELAKAVKIRHDAYARHLPDLAQSLDHAEADDFSPGTVVLLAESKLDGSPLGSMRVQTNEHVPLPLEHSVKLPEWLTRLRLAEASRLGISKGPMGRVVKIALFKAYFKYCQEIGVDWMVITARAPVDRMYEGLLFDDVQPGRCYYPMEHVGNIPHRVLKFEVATAQAKWAAASHPLYDYVFNTIHPDIRLDSASQAIVHEEPDSLSIRLAS